MAERLSEEKIAEIREAFSLFDRDGDGLMGGEDVGTAMRSLGHNPSEGELRAVLGERGRTGGVDFAEFLALVAGRMRDENGDEEEEEEEIREAFRVFDRNGSGFVSAAELRHVLTKVGERMTDREVDEMMGEAECDHRGQVRGE
ncbi:CALMS protein, partial [Bombycilla garrulus]|nr:CALMS protein [Bombycilla garrulus]